MYNRGRKIEKINIAKAIKIYETMIDKYNDIGPTYYLPAFLRLSLCYEREGKYKECLKVIKKDIRQKIKYEIFGQELEVETEPSLFSKEGLDKGTRFLLEDTKPEIENANYVLDLGCG